MNKNNTLQVIKKLKDTDQDFDYYPTTTEILQCIRQHMEETLKDSYLKNNYGNNFQPTVLDIGAGDGRSVEFLTDGKRKVIEKSLILHDKMHKSCIPVGTDFLESNIMPITSDVIFSNPPYQASGGFAIWAEKIILEANSKLIYLVIPQRWKNIESIQIAIRERKAIAEVLGEFGFLDADRPARGTVNVVCIDLCKLTRKTQEAIQYRYRRNSTQNIDPFDLWLSKTFKFNACTRKYGAGLDTGKETESFKDELNQLIVGKNHIEALVQLYSKELLSLQVLYNAIADLPYDVLNTLGASIEKLGETIKDNLSDLKKKYWLELFDRYEPITNKLCNDSRRKLFESFGKQTCIDFTESNIYAITSWVCKNANVYFDTQLIDLYKKFICQANVEKYKSNKKTFDQEKWRFSKNLDKLDKYCLKLDYRLVISGYGELSTEYNSTNGLENRCHKFINDISTVAYNLGFPKTQKSEEFNWLDGQVNFMWPDGTIFMQAKAHLNGNMHLKINTKFLRALNVKFSLLVGWINTPKEAAQEMNITEDQALNGFKSHSIIPSDILMLTEEKK